MSVMTPATTATWDARPYRRIAGATNQQGRLIVRFEDGSQVELEADRVLAPDAQGVDAPYPCRYGLLAARSCRCLSGALSQL